MNFYIFLFGGFLMLALAANEWCRTHQIAKVSQTTRTLFKDAKGGYIGEQFSDEFFVRYEIVEKYK